MAVYVCVFACEFCFRKFAKINANKINIQSNCRTLFFLSFVFSLSEYWCAAVINCEGSISCESRNRGAVLPLRIA